MTKKSGETFYNYKYHAKVDTKSKFIDNIEVTNASVRNLQPLDKLLNENDMGDDIYADSVYTCEEQQKVVFKYGMNNKIHLKVYLTTH